MHGTRFRPMTSWSAVLSNEAAFLTLDEVLAIRELVLQLGLPFPYVFQGRPIEIFFVLFGYIIIVVRSGNNILVCRESA